LNGGKWTRGIEATVIILRSQTFENWNKYRWWGYYWDGEGMCVLHIYEDTDF
jgi:hypothetical protein